VLPCRKLTAQEKAGLIQATAMPKPDADRWQKLEPRARKLESELKAPQLSRPSQVYQVLSKAPGEQILFLLIRSALRLVQDRARNYLQKYLPMAQEVAMRKCAPRARPRGIPKFHKVKEALIAAKLNARQRRSSRGGARGAAPPRAAPPVEPPPGQKRALRQPIVRT